MLNRDGSVDDSGDGEVDEAGGVTFSFTESPFLDRFIGVTGVMGSLRLVPTVLFGFDGVRVTVVDAGVDTGEVIARGVDFLEVFGLLCFGFGGGLGLDVATAVNICRSLMSSPID